MISNPELLNDLSTTETYRVERTYSTSVTQEDTQEDTQDDTQGINHQTLSL